MGRGMNQSAGFAKQALRRAAEFMWPSRSLVSGRRTGAEGAVPPEDWAQLQFITAPLCDTCGIPFEIDLGHGALCAACLARPPKWGRARAALAYNDGSRKPILDLKYAGRRDGVATMAGWMATAGRDLLTSADLIIPVPLHYRRLIRRGYNQSGWLAGGIGALTGTPIAHAAIKRTKATRTQGGLSARLRRRNVAGAFAIRRSASKRIKGARIVLVDDVLTTGATLSACVRVLKAAGAANVDVLVLARVVRERDITI